MLKKKKLTKTDLKTNIISQIKKGNIKMKPRWYFILGSLIMSFGLVGLSMGIIFLFNLSIFLIRRNGPLMMWKLQVILANFPWWIPIVAIIGMIFAIYLLKKYDFSYKKNFLFIVLIFIILTFLAGFLIDKLGLNEYLSKGRVGRFYQNVEINKGKYDGNKGINRYNR